MLKACILATEILKIFLASRIVLRVRQLNSEEGSTSGNHTFDTDTCSLSLS